MTKEQIQAKTTEQLNQISQQIMTTIEYAPMLTGTQKMEMISILTLVQNELKTRN